jgi:hypothetical protein
MMDTGVQTLLATERWMEQTRQQTTYEGVSQDILLNLSHVPWSLQAEDFALGQSEDASTIVSPQEDEKKIWHLTVGIDHMPDRCEETMRHTGRPILCWLLTTQLSSCFPKPFKFFGRESSRRAYRRC